MLSHLRQGDLKRDGLNLVVKGASEVPIPGMSRLWQDLFARFVTLAEDDESNRLRRQSFVVDARTGT